MSTRHFGTCNEFMDALTRFLAENAVGPAWRPRLARAAVKKHPEYNEHEYFLAVETAFAQWEAYKTPVARTCPRRQQSKSLRALKPYRSSQRGSLSRFVVRHA